MRNRFLMTALVAAAWLPGLSRAEQPLLLEEVLDSVRRAYPPLLASLLEREIAEGEVLSAQGRFDLHFRTSVDSDQLGFYSNERVVTGLEQHTSMWGSSYYAGWRVGEGGFAPYDGKLATRSLGEWRGGMKLPLLRNRAIDERRAELRKAEIGRGLASLSVDQQRLSVTQTASRRYWDWVAAGRRHAIALEVLNIALTREEALKEGVRLGQLPAIEVTDNARAILQRRAFVVEAERALQQTAIELSLFYRDAAGLPVVPASGRLPASFPRPADLRGDLQSDMETAVSRRPELEQVRARQDQSRVDADLARNQRLPGVDLGLGFTAESGQGSVRRGPQEIKASLTFDLPLQRRAAAGKMRVAEARIAQLDQRLRFAEDQVRAEVRDALSAVGAAYQRAMVLREEVEVTRQLEEAERTRYQLGDSNLFTVNLREQATVEAAIREVGALADYHRAFALYQMAIAAF